MPTTDDRKVISLFSGAMGLDIGLQQAGLNIVIGQDFDKACISTIVQNNHKVIAGDIRQINPQTILDASGIAQGKIFLVCGGPPCQPFSTAGQRKGINDPRGSLFMDYIRMIDKIRPRFFLMENVKGLMSSPLKSDDPNGFKRVLDIILNEFAKLRYKTVYGLLDAVNYGVPQFRERFIMIGSRDDEDIFLPLPTHFQMHQDPQRRWQTLRSAISDLENDPGEYSEMSESRLKYLKMVPMGGNWHDIPPELLKEAMGGAYLSGGGKVGFYRRLDYNQPCPTLTTSPAQKSTMLCHPTQDRPLSVREYARIQQFPDEWIFSGTISDKYKQIGNAVPVGLARAIGQSIIATAEGNACIKTKRTRGTNVHARIINAMTLGGNHYAK